MYIPFVFGGLKCFCYALLLACPAVIITGLPYDDVWQLHLPVPTEVSVGYLLHYISVSRSGGLTTGSVVAPNFLDQ